MFSLINHTNIGWAVPTNLHPEHHLVGSAHPTLVRCRAFIGTGSCAYHDISYSAAYTTYILMVSLIVSVIVAVVEIDVPRVVGIVSVGSSRPVVVRLAHYPPTFCLPGQTHHPSGPVRPGTKGCIPMPGKIYRAGRTHYEKAHSFIPQDDDSGRHGFILSYSSANPHSGG